MNKIEKLVEKICPNGVEFKELGDVCDFKYGKGNTIPTIGGEFPVYGCNGIVGMHNEYNNENSPIIGHIGSAGVVIWGKGKHYVTYNGTICKPIVGVVLSKYIYYNLLILKLTSLTKGSQPFLSYGTIKKLVIPVPPLEIQEKIVEILDQFTQLETELETELEARKAQYQFYRNQLLAFENKQVEWKILGTLAKIGDGLHGTPKYCLDGDYSFINGNNLVNGSVKYFESTKKVNELMYEKHGLKFFKKKTIFLSINGTIGSLAIYRDEKIVLGKSVAYFNITDNTLNPKFLYYYFQGNIARNYFESEKTGSTIKNLGLKALRTFKIPVPPLAEQERIVKILDQFDDLVNNISSGLPAEIKARRQQYEYYRAKLLTFKVMENH